MIVLLIVFNDIFYNYKFNIQKCLVVYYVGDNFNWSLCVCWYNLYVGVIFFYYDNIYFWNEYCKISI